MISHNIIIGEQTIFANIYICIEITYIDSNDEEFCMNCVVVFSMQVQFSNEFTQVQLYSVTVVTYFARCCCHLMRDQERPNNTTFISLKKNKIIICYTKPQFFPFFLCVCLSVCVSLV